MFFLWGFMSRRSADLCDYFSKVYVQKGKPSLEGFGRHLVRADSSMVRAGYETVARACLDSLTNHELGDVANDIDGFSKGRELRICLFEFVAENSKGVKLPKISKGNLPDPGRNSICYGEGAFC